MDLAAKLKDLRHHAGHARGFGRALTQAEVAAGISALDGSNMSQGYISQLERGRRVHLTQPSRGVLALFFGVHPGYLVSDPEPSQPAMPSSNIYHHQHHIAHRTLARLAIHPRNHAVWPIIERLIDLPEDDFHAVRDWIEARSSQPVIVE